MSRGGNGVGQLVTREADMAAFDQLPRSVRNALNYHDYKVGAEACLKGMYLGARYIVGRIRQQSPPDRVPGTNLRSEPEPVHEGPPRNMREAIQQAMSRGAPCSA